MQESPSERALLKTILDNLHQPAQLDNHPWTASRMVLEACRLQPGLDAQSPGQQLVQAVSSLFRRMLPANPPRQGLRLDTRWGEFGILAAQYFAPLLFDLPYPASIKEAWHSIDQAILLFVFENPAEISPEECARYQLVGNEPQVAPNSTLSDWNRKGLERFQDLLLQHEAHLELNADLTSPQENPGALIQFLRKISPPRKAWVWIGRVTLAILVILLAICAWQGWLLYQRAQVIRQQAEQILAISRSLPELDNLPEITENMHGFRLDLVSFQADTRQILSLAPYLGWVPVHGGDLTQAPLLLEMAVQAAIAGDEILQVIDPIFAPTEGDRSEDILSLLSGLGEADTQLVVAQIALSNIQAARQQLRPEVLSPQVQDIITTRIDPLLSMLDSAFPATDVLQMARLAPRLLGSAGNGRQTYLVLIQNEDELRPTGGFLTAVGLVEIENGQLKEITFESSDIVDDLSKAYPKPPWQLDTYMKASILLLRDANWFTNFPSTVEWVEFLYMYSRPLKIDGVIAIDQYVVQELLRVVGPIQVRGVDDPVSADNILTFMRAAKQQTPPEGIPRNEWDRKQFISWLADPLLQKLRSVEKQDQVLMSRVMIRLLDEKHILLQFDDPEMSALVVKLGWDGSLEPAPNKDFLMVVDANVGFNKTNAVTDTRLKYSLDLADLQKPMGTLEVSFTNHSPADGAGGDECIQFEGNILDLPLDQREYKIHDCYWSYLRVYTPTGTVLAGSTPQDIPAHWHLREEYVPPRTDVLDENIPGVQAFGTLLVVPPQQPHQVSLTFRLPAEVVRAEPEGSAFTYRLHVQKQPGTKAVPIAISLNLPAGATVQHPPPGFEQSQGTWQLLTDLRQDLSLEFTFHLPG